MNLLKALLDTFLCKYYSLRKLYPLVILPKVSYAYRIKIENLKSGSLVRRSELTPERIFNSLGVLREDAILENDVPGMSMNLLGGKFKEIHIGFVPKGKGMEDWKGNRIYFIDYRNNFKRVDECSPIYFNLKSLDGKTFPYYRTDNPETRKILKALNKDANGTAQGVQVQGYAKVVHAPNNLNYWHVEFAIFDIQNNRITKTSSKWQKSAAQLALAHIISGSALPNLATVSPVDEVHYLKGHQA